MGRKADVLLYSHHLLEEIEAMPLGRQILPLVTVLIDGPYVRELNDSSLGLGLRGSSNQKLRFLNCDEQTKALYQKRDDGIRRVDVDLSKRPCMVGLLPNFANWKGDF